MRKRRGHSQIEQLEQRRLLSSAGGEVDITYHYPVPQIQPTAPTNGDLGIQSVAISGILQAGGTFSIMPQVIQTQAMGGVSYVLMASLSTDSIFGNGDDIQLSPVLYGSGYFQGGEVTIPGTTPPGDYKLLLDVIPEQMPGGSSSFPPDTDLSDNFLNAGTFSVLAAGADATGAAILADDGIVAATFPIIARAGTFISLVPQTIATGDLANFNTSVTITLSSDDTLGDSDNVTLTEVLPPQPSSNGNADDWSLFEQGETQQAQTQNTNIYQIPPDLVPGTYAVFAQVSPLASSNSATPPADTNAGDDILDAGSITVQPYLAPDMLVTSATFPTSLPAGMNTIDIEPLVTRRGALTKADYNVSVALSVSGVLGAQDNINLTPSDWSAFSEPASHSGNYNIPQTVRPGTYQVLVSVAPVLGAWDSYLPADADATDNELDAGTLTITPNDWADVGISGATTPATGTAGFSIDVEPTVVQYGALANSDYNINVQLSTSGIWDDSGNISLSSGEMPFHSGQISIPATTPGATYQLLLEVEPYSGSGVSLPGDSDPSDDIFNAGNIDVAPAPTDMGVTAATFPSTAGAGDYIVVQPTITRMGDLANTDYEIDVALSASGIWGDADNIPLTAAPMASGGNDPFQSGYMVIPDDAPTGSYELLVHIEPWSADGSALPTDTVASDDTLDAGPIAVTEYIPADLGLGPRPIYDRESQPGAGLRIQADIIQTGAYAALNYNLSVVLSTDDIYGNSDDIDLSPNGWWGSGDFYHGNDWAIPSTVSPGSYELFIHISDWSGPGYLAPGVIGPTDTNPADDTLDVGEFTVEAPYTPPTLNPPIYNPPPYTPPYIPPTNFPTTPAPVTGDDSVTSATFPATGQAGKDIDVEPTVSRTAGLANVDYNISVQLSTSGVWGDSGNFNLDAVSSGFVIGGSSFHSGNMSIPTDVPAGNYQLLVQMQPYQNPEFNPLNSPAPVDTNPSDDVVNAGTITITPYLAPDLGISSATFPTTAAAGTNIDIEPTIIQVGGFENYGYNVTAVLSKDDTLGNNDDISLMQGYNFGDRTFDGSVQFPYHSGNLLIPANVVPGVYHLFLSVAESDELSVLIPDSTPPPDGDLADNTLDAGTITITANPSTINPGGPIQNPTPFADVSPGQRFHIPSSSSGKYSGLYLSTDSILDVSRGASQKLLNMGATVSLGTPDTKLKTKGGELVVPPNTPAGTYYLIATFSNGSQYDALGTIIVDAPTPQLQATIRAKSKSLQAGGIGQFSLAIKNTGLASASDVTVELFASRDTGFSDDDTQLTTSDLSAISLASKAKTSGIYSANIPSSLASANYYIFAVAEYNGTSTLIGLSGNAIVIS